MMKNKGEEKELEMLVEGGGQHLAQGKGQHLVAPLATSQGWGGLVLIGWRKKRSGWAPSRSSVVQTFCCIQGVGVEVEGKEEGGKHRGDLSI